MPPHNTFLWQNPNFEDFSKTSRTLNLPDLWDLPSWYLPPFSFPESRDKLPIHAPGCHTNTLETLSNQTDTIPSCPQPTVSYLYHVIKCSSLLQLQPLPNDLPDSTGFNFTLFTYFLS